MFEYKLALRCGGLMEDAEWHNELIRTVKANSLKEAKNKWAEVTGEDKKDTWNPIDQTIWGWKVVLIYTNNPDEVNLIH